jgi:hypothetical protein
MQTIERPPYPGNQTEIPARELPVGAYWYGFIRPEALDRIQKHAPAVADIHQARISNGEPVDRDPQPEATATIWRRNLTAFVVVLNCTHIEGFTTFSVSLV